MRRRALLCRIAGSAACVAGLSGCAGRSAGPGGDGGRTTTTDRGTTTTDGTTTTARPGGSADVPPSRWDLPADPFETVRVGDPAAVALPEHNRPHEVRVWNDGAERSLALELRRDEATVFETTATAPADGLYRLTVVEPGAYDLRVGVDGETSTVPVPPRYFDCNHSATTVRVADDVDHRSATTEMACPAPVVTSATLDSGPGGCGSRNDATVSARGSTLSVEGSVRAPTPCHLASLADVTYSTEDPADALVVTVGTVDDGSDVCVDCVGTVPYDATVRLADAPPTLVVRHRTGDGTETVARWDGPADPTTTPD